MAADGAMKSDPLTRRDILAALGPIDDLLIAEMIDTGATCAELTEALAWAAGDERLANSGHGRPAGRTARLVEIMAEIEREESDEAILNIPS